MITSEIRPITEFEYEGKTVILRLDINSPIDPKTKKIANDNRIRMSVPTVKYLLDHKARLVILAHQGDTLDYHNLIPMQEHAERLSQLVDVKIRYIDDVAGPAAVEAVKELVPGDAVLLGNLRYLTEEVSTFENDVKLKSEEMLNTYLVRNLTPLADYYVNDAFSAAHRNAPSMVAFQELLPTAGGFLMINEMDALNRVVKSPKKPAVFVLGGLKISDGFGMMKEVLEKGTADYILACGIAGEVMLLAQGISIGARKEKFIRDRSLNAFFQPARTYLNDYRGKIIVPVDLAYEKDGERYELPVSDLPKDEMFMDIGSKTIKLFKDYIGKAGTIFVNGPAGAYENKIFEKGTKEICKAIADAGGYSVIGGGDTVSAAGRFIDLGKINYVCTAGGAMIRFISGKKLPLVEAMTKAFKKHA